MNDAMQEILTMFLLCVGVKLTKKAVKVKCMKGSKYMAMRPNILAPIKREMNIKHQPIKVKFEKRMIALSWLLLIFLR